MVRGRVSIECSDISKLLQFYVPVTVGRHVGINYLNLLPKVLKVQNGNSKGFTFSFGNTWAAAGNRKCIIQLSGLKVSQILRDSVVMGLINHTEYLHNC